MVLAHRPPVTASWGPQAGDARAVRRTWFPVSTPPPHNAAFLFPLLPAQQPATACVLGRNQSRCGPAFTGPAPATGAPSLRFLLSGRTPSSPAWPQEFHHGRDYRAQTLPMITSQGPGTWSTQMSLSHGAQHLVPDSLPCPTQSLAGHLASLVSSRARLDWHSSDAPTVGVCGPRLHR